MGLSKGQMITGGIAAAGILADILMDPEDAKVNKTTEYLWKFVEHESIYSDKKTDEGARKYGYGPAPDLVGVGQSTQPGRSTGSTGGNSSIEHVDVVNNFKWTQSPKSSRDDVPVLMLREKKIQVNPQLNQIANNLFVAAEKLGRGKEMLKSLSPQELAKKINDNKVTAENELGTKLIAAGRAIGSAAESMAAGSGILAPYENLYYTKDTGFVYSLPYMEESYKSVENMFGPGGEGSNSQLLGMAGGLAKGIKDIARGFNIADPGTYVEQPQLYNFGGRNKKSYTVNFPLINTNSFNDVIRNWQLIFLLIYQNTPNRLTRDLIDPPCIYEANLDGTWYSKYAYVSKVSVDFVGATRKMSLPIPSEVTADGDGTQSKRPFPVETIIPDIYKVSVTVQEIFSETQNMLYHSINQQNRKVTTERRDIENNTPTSVENIAGALGRNIQ